MKKVVVLSCTNRPESNTLKVSKIYAQVLKNKSIEVELLDFRHLPPAIAFTESFGNRSQEYANIVNNYVSQQSKFVFIVPEYNGSFPGILKTFLDSMSPREWNGKKACLVGVSDGRAGNLRGMEHLTGILHYLKMDVYYNKLPISQVHKMIDSDGQFNEEQLKVCGYQIDGFLNF